MAKLACFTSITRFYYKNLKIQALKFFNCGLVNFQYFDSLYCTSDGILYAPLEAGKICAINLNGDLENVRYLTTSDLTGRVKKILKSEIRDFLYICDKNKIMEVSYHLF
jgi:hypothetical protein